MCAQGCTCHGGTAQSLCRLSPALPCQGMLVLLADDDSDNHLAQLQSASQGSAVPGWLPGCPRAHAGCRDQARSRLPYRPPALARRPSPPWLLARLMQGLGSDGREAHIVAAHCGRAAGESKDFLAWSKSFPSPPCCRGWGQAAPAGLCAGNQRLPLHGGSRDGAGILLTLLSSAKIVSKKSFYHMHKISAPRGDPGVGVGWPHSIAQGFTLGQKLRKQKAWAKVRKGDSGSNLSTVQAGFGSPGLWLLLPAQSQEQPSMSSKAEHSLTHRDTENGPTSPSWGHLAQQLTCTATSFPPQISFLLPGEKALPVDRGQDGMLRAASTHTAAGPLHNPLSVSLQVAMRGDAVAACFCHATATGRCQRFAAPGDVF